MQIKKNYDLPPYLSGFSKEQLRVIYDTSKNKQVVAGAGSGKTKTIIGLLEYVLRNGIEKSKRILLLSFSRKAVAELKERLPKDLQEDVEISTFHSFCFQKLKKIYPKIFSKVKIISEKEILNFIYSYLKQDYVLNEIGAIPIPLLWEEKVIFQKLFPTIFKDTIEAYKEYKASRYFFEFDDLIKMMLKTLAKENKKISRLKRSYDLIIVDEFQDTDLYQLEFLKQMKAKRRVVVGDDWQAIYGFRGATLKPFLNFKKIFQAKVLSLKYNFRSLGEIIHLGNKIIKNSSKQIRKKIQAVRKTDLDMPIISYEIDPLTCNHFVKYLKSPSQKTLKYKLLVRTNWQKEFWHKNGLAEENIMTIHKSKGLEFPVVFLDLSQGWGLRGKKNQKIEDEEIRLLYVGASRAMDLLVMLHYPEDLRKCQEKFYYEKIVMKYSQAYKEKGLDLYLKQAISLRKD